MEHTLLGGTPKPAFIILFFGKKFGMYLLLDALV